jgi:hypothetical protein
MTQGKVMWNDSKGRRLWIPNKGRCEMTTKGMQSSTTPLRYSPNTDRLAAEFPERCLLDEYDFC